LLLKYCHIITTLFFEQQTIIDFFIKELNIRAVYPNKYIYSYQTLANIHPSLSKKIGVSIRKSCSYSIGPEYISKVYPKLKQSIINQDNIFDFAFISQISMDKITSTNFANAITDFIFVEKGECIQYPNIYSINLVCSSAGNGKLLLALYIYAIIKHYDEGHKEHQGILELANAYINLPGLCLYSKFGFKFDNSLFGENCFSDRYNLPMIINTKEYGISKEEKIEYLMDILHNDVSGFGKPVICNIVNQKIQFLIGVALNILIFLDDPKNSKKLIVSDYSSPDGDINYLYLFNNFKNKQDIEQFIQNIYNLPKQEIDDYYNHIYTKYPLNLPPSPPRVNVSKPRITRSSAKQSIKTKGKKSKSRTKKISK